jgi:hypothetical protein
MEGCSQTVPVWLVWLVWLFGMERDQTGAVWLLINIWNQWLLHDGLLFVGHHVYIFWYIGRLTASVQPGVAFVEADIQPIMKNPISFNLAIDESSLESYRVKEALFVS